jgi:hypothetical protein
MLICVKQDYVSPKKFDGVSFKYCREKAATIAHEFMLLFDSIVSRIDDKGLR